MGHEMMTWRGCGHLSCQGEGHTGSIGVRHSAGTVRLGEQAGHWAQGRRGGAQMKEVAG